MGLAAILNGSFVDYPNHIASVLFFNRCNFRCPSCHARAILDAHGMMEVSDACKALKSRRRWIDGVVLCGGEATLEENLLDIIQTLKQYKFLIKLDTNGSAPETLEELLGTNLIDYVAMDVKSTPDTYDVATGVDVSVSDIEKSMQLVQQFPDYEFRTTIVPLICADSDTGYRYLDADDMIRIAQWIADATGKNTHRYYLQKFVARNEKLINRSLETCPELSKQTLLELKRCVSKYLPKSELRA